MTYRSGLNNLDLVILTHTNEFSHAAHVYETVKKQMAEVDKGLTIISQEVRTHIAKKCGGFNYRQIEHTSAPRTASNYDNVKQGMDDVVAPIVEEYLTGN